MRRTASKYLLVVGLPVALLTPRIDRPPDRGDETGLANPVSATHDVTPDGRKARLGRAIFFDEDLSINRNQSCAACHGEEWGFTGPDSVINARGAVYEGSVAGRFGNRKPTASAYATPSPVLGRKREGKDFNWVGGNFWDGRATGERLGNPAADQAQGPFLNPVEQGLPDAACVVFRVSQAAYADLYVQVWGDSIRSISFPANTDALCAVEGTTVPLRGHDRAGVTREFDRIGLAIAAFEDSPEVNRFSSKFDAWRDGKAKLTSEEHRGLALFQGKANCERCHPSGGKRPLFTDFTYDNLGVPKNPENPVYTQNPAFVDTGLGGFLRDQNEQGKVKVPTLRNVDRRPFPGATKAYMHNGVFKSLEQLVHFYNTRDVLPRCETLAVPVFAVNCWPAPEVEQNVNRDELGNLGLSEAEERAIVAFLKTLGDGYVSR